MTQFGSSHPSTGCTYSPPDAVCTSLIQNVYRKILRIQRNDRFEPSVETKCVHSEVGSDFINFIKIC